MARGRVPLPPRARSGARLRDRRLPDEHAVSRLRGRGHGLARRRGGCAVGCTCPPRRPRVARRRAARGRAAGGHRVAGGRPCVVAGARARQRRPDRARLRRRADLHGGRKLRPQPCARRRPAAGQRPHRPLDRQRPRLRPGRLPQRGDRRTGGAGGPDRQRRGAGEPAAARRPLRSGAALGLGLRAKPRRRAVAGGLRRLLRPLVRDRAAGRRRHLRQPRRARARPARSAQRGAGDRRRRAAAAGPGGSAARRAGHRLSRVRHHLRALRDHRRRAGSPPAAGARGGSGGIGFGCARSASRRSPGSPSW